MEQKGIRNAAIIHEGRVYEGRSHAEIGHFMLKIGACRRPFPSGPAQGFVTHDGRFVSRVVYVPHNNYWFRRKLASLEGSRLTDKGKARKIGVSVKFLGELKNETSVSYFEDTRHDHNGKSNWEEALPDNKPDPTADSCESDVKAVLARHIGRLKPNEQKVIMGMFFGDEGKLRVVADSMDVSPERVRQIYMEAIRKLRFFIVNDWNSEKKTHISQDSGAIRRADKFRSSWGVDRVVKRQYQEIIGSFMGGR